MDPFLYNIGDFESADSISPAAVLPDNVRFEGGLGETVRKEMLEMTGLRTNLRLPTGIFCKQGVKAKVLLLDNHNEVKKPWTKEE